MRSDGSEEVHTLVRRGKRSLCFFFNNGMKKTSQHSSTTRVHDASDAAMFAAPRFSLPSVVFNVHRARAHGSGRLMGRDTPFLTRFTTSKTLLPRSKTLVLTCTGETRDYTGEKLTTSSASANPSTSRWRLSTRRASSTRGSSTASSARSSGGT